jgi:anthranilate synthase/aminodeoxychorismate synthase-like glutamine amidotransferase
LSPLELSPLDVLPLDVLPLDVLLLDVLLLDNRDSFTFNLAQAFGELGCSVEVVDADLVSAAQIVALRESGRGPRVVVVGPGPRGPADLPRLVDLVQQLDGRVPLFGVCLGLQVLVRARGGQVARALEPVHGKVRRVHHEGSGCFAGLPDPTWVMRYHSLVASEVPPSLTVTAVDDDGQVMAVRDAARSVQAVQFHPESVGTAGGLSLLRNVVVEAGVAVPDVVARPGGVPPPSWTPAFGYGANGLGAGAPAGPANDQHRGGQ